MNDWFDNKGTPMLGRDICRVLQLRAPYNDDFTGKSLIDAATKAAAAEGGEDTASTAATETKSSEGQVKEEEVENKNGDANSRRGFVSDAVRLEEMLW